MRRAILSAVALGILASAACKESGDDGGVGVGADSVPPEFNPPGTADEVFAENELNIFRLTMAPADWQSIISDSRGDQWRRGALQWKNHVLRDVAIRPHGEWTRVAGNRKMSVVLKFDEFVPGRLFKGLRKLRLDGLSADASMMRDRLSYGLFRPRMAAPRVAHGRLFVNGEYRGLYMAEESVDEVMVQSRFGSELGDLYRIRSSAPDPYAFVTGNAGDYVPFPWEPKNDIRAPDPSRVIVLVQALAANPSAAPSVCDMDALMTYLAVEAAISDSDGLAGDFGANNHFQYYRPLAGRFVIIPWDADSSWWDEPPTRGIYQNFQRSRLTAMIETDPVLRQAYKARIGQLLAAEMQPANVHARVDFIYEQIREAAHADPNKPYSNVEFDDSAAFIKEYANQRHVFLQTQIAMP